MLLIITLWLDSFKAINAKILPMGRVTYSEGEIKCHMDKIIHYGEKITINKDGLYSLGPLRSDKCL